MAIDGRQTIPRPWSGLTLLGLVALTNLLWFMIVPRWEPSPGGLGFWGAVAAFWIIPIRWVPFYLFVAGVGFAVIACVILFAPYHKPETFEWQVALSAGAAVLMFAGVGISDRALKNRPTDL